MSTGRVATLVALPLCLLAVAPAQGQEPIVDGGHASFTVELEQRSTTSERTDLGFVPLLDLSGEWRFAPRWHAELDADALVGGPGRAEDVTLQAGYDLGDRWTLSPGYRTVEGGADVNSVYAFAWLHYGVVSLEYRF